MAKFKIIGQQPLKGEIEVSGSKNAALPLICATLLSKERSILNNVPEILDIEVLLEIIKLLGARVERSGNRVSIDPSKVKPKKISPEYFAKLRASILLLGPLVGRFGQARLNHPGGCIIGRRPIDTHLEAIKDLGGKVKENADSFEAGLGEIKNRDIYLHEASVTATENTLMIAASRPTKTTIEFAACEPHITNLCQALSQMGAEIEGVGSNKIAIRGRRKLGGFNIKVIPDEIEVGTFIALGAAAQAPLTIKGIEFSNLKPILTQVDQMGIKYGLEKDKLVLKPPFKIKTAKIQTQPWPGFPTDLQAPFTILATQIRGTTLVHESMYDQRLFYIDDLVRMGANIILCDPHRAVVNGPTPLNGVNFASPDLRAGIALVIAALIAKGTSIIDNIEQIDRGYHKIEDRLKGIGAKINRIR